MESTDAVIEAIRRKCRRDGWYAGELLSPENVVGVRADDPRRGGFAYPPASEELLHATEEALGFPLPALLRALYAQLANGGFGPETGLRGCIGGYGTPEQADEPDETIVGSYDFHRQTAALVDLGQYAASWQEGPLGSRRLFLSAEVWPRYLLPICDRGDGGEACLACDTGAIYRVGRRSVQEWVIVTENPTLQVWLERWLGERR